MNASSEHSESISLVTRAAAFAAEAHRDQRRKSSDQPYINHLLRVGDHAARAGLDPDAISAAYLHDVLEDTPVTEAELRQLFPNRMVDLVLRLTQDWSDDASDEVKRQRKPAYYAGILGDPVACALKLLDRGDNLQEMRRDLPKVRRWAERYATRTREEISAVHDRAENIYACEFYAAALAALEQALKSTPSRGRDK